MVSTANRLIVLYQNIYIIYLTRKDVFSDSVFLHSNLPYLCMRKFISKRTAPTSCFALNYAIHIVAIATLEPDT